MRLTLIAAGSAVVLALCGAGAAAAGSGSTPASAQSPTQDKLIGAVAVFDAAVAYLNLDAHTLFQDLRNGQSLAQIAAAQGKTTDGLVDVVVSATETQLDAAVSTGKLSSAKEQALLAKLRTALGTLVTKRHAAVTQAGMRPLPVTLFFQPVLTKVQLRILTVPNTVPNTPKTAPTLGTHA
jgi:hypothetical protein